MTEQYLQKTINREGFRRVDQSEIDTTLTIPAVVLGPDDKFVECADDGVTGPYQVNMPIVSDCSGVQFTIKNTGAVDVTVASAEVGGVAVNTFDGGASPLGVLTAPDFNTILNGGAPFPPVPPAIVGLPATDWKIIKAPAAP